jgi:hypothetical protein
MSTFLLLLTVAWNKVPWRVKIVNFPRTYEASKPCQGKFVKKNLPVRLGFEGQFLLRKIFRRKKIL